MGKVRDQYPKTYLNANLAEPSQDELLENSRNLTSDGKSPIYHQP